MHFFIGKISYEANYGYFLKDKFSIDLWIDSFQQKHSSLPCRPLFFSDFGLRTFEPLYYSNY